MKVLITIPDRALEIIDPYCKSERYNRSALLVLGALEYIKKHPISNFRENYNAMPTGDVTAPLSEKKPKTKERGMVCPHGRMWGLCEKGCK